MHDNSPTIKGTYYSSLFSLILITIIWSQWLDHMKSINSPTTYGLDLLGIGENYKLIDVSNCDSDKTCITDICSIYKNELITMVCVDFRVFNRSTMECNKNYHQYDNYVELNYWRISAYICNLQ